MAWEIADESYSGGHKRYSYKCEVCGRDTTSSAYLAPLPCWHGKDTRQEAKAFEAAKERL